MSPASSVCWRLPGLICCHVNGWHLFWKSELTRVWMLEICECKAKQKAMAFLQASKNSERKRDREIIINKKTQILNRLSSLNVLTFTSHSLPNHLLLTVCKNHSQLKPLKSLTSLFQKGEVSRDVLRSLVGWRG